jgi:propionate CoA-transferase
VIVQVEQIAGRGTLNARQVKIPGILVDCVVVADPENHWQTFAVKHNPAFSSEIKVPVETLDAIPLDERKIIARRATLELKLNSVVNLGIGMPEGVANVANEEGMLDYLTLTTEPGTIGGIPAGGLNFGAAANMDALIDQPYQFDFYDGGGLDVAVLGLAQADRHGNLNVSKFGPRLAGAGGFINISQNAKKIVFVGTFMAGELQVAIDDGKLKIIREGRQEKFVAQVEHVTFSGDTAVSTGQPVVYITERCVFRLTPEGMELTEIAPGIDLQKDILDRMGFQPVMRKPPVLMDRRVFMPEPMGLKDRLIDVPLEDRLTYNAEENVFFVNFEGLAVRSSRQIAEIRANVDAILGPVGRKVYTIVNYDNFSITPELENEYVTMVKYVAERYYQRTTRYTTSAFLRVKLGKALEKRDVPPYIFESPAEARDALKRKD